MAKTILITEEQARNLFSLRLNEMAGDVVFGKCTYLASNLAKLKTLPNNIYTNTRLEMAYDEWMMSEPNSTTQEYANYCKSVEYFMNNVLEGMVNSIENKKNRGVPFNYLILDPGWMRIAIQGGDRTSDTGENEGKNTGFRCLYTLILTVYQNPSIWNEYCFNPMFEKYRNYASGLVKQAISLDPKYKEIMPLKELKEINAFKANESNKDESRMYNDDWRINTREGGDVTDTEEMD